MTSQDPTTAQRKPSGKGISRRRFLQGAGAAAGLLVTGCGTGASIQALDPTATAGPPPTRTPAPTATPPPTSTAAPSPTRTAAPSPTPVPTPAVMGGTRTQVAIAQAPTYDAALVRRQIEAMLDGIGGLGDVISPGDRVAIKVNLTGGTSSEGQTGVPAVESYVTHPEIVRALGELLRDAGAGQLFIVEAVYEWDSYRLWGYEDAAAALGATLIDLNSPLPYADFASTPVGSEAFVYERFTFNRILEEVDAFVSVAKMKCHWNCGVTHAMKNLIGLVPARHYVLEEEHWWRSALHGPDEAFKTRLPRVILDLNRARPIDLALIDGIKTAESGEGPWQPGFAPVQPGVLVAGKDPVAADAVATAVMGFDPTANTPAAPFLRADNYLNMAHALGLGTNRLREIGVVGAQIDQVRHPFAACWQ